MRVAAVFVGGALFAVGYGLGGATIHLRLWPYEHIQAAKNWIDGDAQYVARVHPKNGVFEAFDVRADIVMVEDSITEAGLWGEFFPGVSVANRGIGGDTALDLVARVDTLLKVEPKRAFIMVGINDALKGASAEQVLANYERLIDALQGAGVEVVVQSTIECRREDCGRVLETVRAVNAGLKPLAERKGAAFVDLNADLAEPAGGLKAEHTYDGIHLTGEAYRLWAARLRPLMAL